MGKPHIFFKKDISKEISAEEASDDEKAEDKARKIQVTSQETSSVNNSSGSFNIKEENAYLLLMNKRKRHSNGYG